MKLRILLICFFLVAITGVAQQTIDSTNVDLRYREDQFYIGVTYNLIGDKPNGVSQSGFSSGFHFGFIRDMPINEKRNVAFGLGLGLSSNSYNQNMLIESRMDGYDYSIIDETEVSIKKNKFTTYLIEAPLEFRWRTSTAKDYKFWRIYTGVKLGYVFYSSSKYRGSLGTIKNNNISDINTLQYGLTFSAGYSTWNFHVYYGLNPIFKDTALINGAFVEMNSIKIGLMFYIL